jgi:phosphoglycerol transferase MdoB-like AlkP superfamily enzyme
MMESMSAENMMRLGGEEEVMPGLDSLCSEGLLFTRFYASGFRTEQGLIALLSSFPAQPTVTIQREFGKFERLPSLPRTLVDAGYTCNYYYSGDLNFANTSAYLNASAFTKLLDRDAREWQRTTEWGALDEELFQCHLKEAGSDATPFFSVLMTTTNHEPFDAPVTHLFKEGQAANYKNTAHYTDSCLFSYIQAAKLQPWYANTLFIVTADHAHFYPENRGKSDPERHHIPFLMLGGALQDAYRGSVNDKPASQVDLSSLILHQLKLPDTSFQWSRNPLNPCCPGYAFYSFDNGFGWITATETVVYDHDQKKIIFPQGNSIPSAQCVRQGKAYLQMVYDEYLGK